MSKNLAENRTTVLLECKGKKEEGHSAEELIGGKCGYVGGWIRRNIPRMWNRV